MKFQSWRNGNSYNIERIAMFSTESKIIKKLSGKKYESYYVPLPKKVFSDSQFPFKYGEKISISIDVDNNRVIIKKVMTIIEEKVEATGQIETIKEQANKPDKENKQTMIEKKKPTPKKSQNQTQMIICPKCTGKNVLISQSSTERKCTHCGFNIKKENYEFVE